MFDSLASARNVLDEIARGFDASSLSPQAALRVVDELGVIRRVVDGMTAKAAKRAVDGDAHVGFAAKAVAHTLGVATGEVRAAIETATLLESLPATDRAVREGLLSARAAQMIAYAATHNPRAEADLLDVADRGLVPLRDACVAARAAVEDPAGRSARQRKLREWAMGPDGDGMLAGRFRFTPEVGGFLKSAIETQQQRIYRNHKSGEHESLAAYAADAVADLILGTATAAAPDAEIDPGAPTLDDTTSVTPVTTADATPITKGVDAVVHIVIDHGTVIRGGTADGEVCEIPGVGPVDVNWVKELLGSAFLTVVIKKGKDILTVAHLGRHVPAEVMTALLVSGRECDIEGCNNRGYLERDHAHDHAQGGPTSFANLGWLCYLHHRLKSSGWQLGPAAPETRTRVLRPPP